jgi:hypothetical protein
MNVKFNNKNCAFNCQFVLIENYIISGKLKIWMYKFCNSLKEQKMRVV